MNAIAKVFRVLVPCFLSASVMHASVCPRLSLFAEWQIKANLRKPRVVPSPLEGIQLGFPTPEVVTEIELLFCFFPLSAQRLSSLTCSFTRNSCCSVRVTAGKSGVVLFRPLQIGLSCRYQTPASDGYILTCLSVIHQG